MNEEKPQSKPGNCPACGATRRPDVAVCWLCGADLSPVDGSAISTAEPPRTSPASVQAGMFSYSLATLMIVVTLVAVVCGIFSVAPGLGIPMAIIMLPVFVRTSMVVRQREMRGEDVSFATRAALFAGSFWTAIVILIVVGIASVGTFCGVCLGVYFGLASSGDSVAVTAASIIAGIATTITTILAIWFSVRRIRRRWERDALQTPDRRP